MDISRATAMKIWEDNYFKAKYTTDFAGNWMCKDGFGNPNFTRYINGKRIRCGWNIHHILPLAKGGKNEKSNLICTNIETNNLAADKTSFWVNGMLYQVQKIYGSSEHEIVCLSDIE